MRLKSVYSGLFAVSVLASLNAFAADPAANPAAAPATDTTPAAQLTEPSLPEASSITGTVQTVQATPAATLTAADYLDVQYKPGNSKAKMQEYNITINNKQPKHVELLQLEVTNGVDEQTYVQLQQQKSQTSRRLAGGMLRGLTGVASSFIPYAGVGSVAAYQAIGAGTNVLYNTANVIENTGGSADYSGHVVQRANNIMISPNQQFQCLAVTPNKQQPVVKIVFKDLESNQIYDLQK
jgi:hypothetical protein